VKIAFMGALTGPNAQLGINIYQGAQLAFKAYNDSNPTVKVDFVKYDTQGDPTQATNVVKKVVSDKDVAVVGPAFSGESKTADPVLEQAQIPNISASATNTALSSNGWKFWHRVLANDAVQGAGDADFMAKTLKAKQVAVIDDKSDYGKGLADAITARLKADGTSVVDREAIDPKSDDYSSTVNKIKAAKPQVTFYAGYYAEASKFVKQLRDGGVTAKFMSGDGTLDQQFVKGGGPAAEGAFLSCTCVAASSSKAAATQKFVADYKAAWKSAPATYSAEGFDAATAYINALKAGKTTAADINSFLSTEDFEGVSKHIKWDAKGELSGGAVFVSEVQASKIAFLGDVLQAKPLA
jgi:branched-chain amino acid transport system substrate-binding protein